MFKIIEILITFDVFEPDFRVLMQDSLKYRFSSHYFKKHSFTCKEKGCSLFAINFILSQAIYRMVSGLIGGTSGEVKFYATALNLG